MGLAFIFTLVFGTGLVEGFGAVLAADFAAGLGLPGFGTATATWLAAARSFSNNF